MLDVAHLDTQVDLLACLVNRFGAAEDRSCLDSGCKNGLQIILPVTQNNMIFLYN
jgi:hypothetical protein